MTVQAWNQQAKCPERGREIEGGSFRQSQLAVTSCDCLHERDRRARAEVQAGRGQVQPVSLLVPPVCGLVPTAWEQVQEGPGAGGHWPRTSSRHSNSGSGVPGTGSTIRAVYYSERRRHNQQGHQQRHGTVLPARLEEGVFFN